MKFNLLYYQSCIIFVFHQTKIKRDDKQKQNERD